MAELADVTEPAELPPPDEQLTAALFSSRTGSPPVRFKPMSPTPKSESPVTPGDIPSSENFKGQRPRQRKPINEGKKKKGTTPRPKKEVVDDDAPDTTTDYGPAVSRRPGASGLLIQSADNMDEKAQEALFTTFRGAAVSTPSTPPSMGGAEDATSSASAEDTPPVAAVEQLNLGADEATTAPTEQSMASSPDLERSVSRVPAKWDTLMDEGGHAKPKKSKGADGEGGGGGKKKKGGFFSKKSKAAPVHKFEAKTALAYYGTIGGGFGTPRLGLGVALGQFNVPAWLAVRPTGELVVSSVFAHEVQMCSPRGGPALVLTQGAGKSRLDNPQGVAINAEGTEMWVANGGLDAVVKYTIDPNKGMYSATATEQTHIPSLKMPQGLAVEQNVLFVASSGNNHIAVLDATRLSLLYSFGQRTIEGGPLLQRPTDLAIYHGGGRGSSQVYVVDCGNSRLVVFSTDGDFIKTIGKFGTEPGQFHEPLGISIREEKVFVCEGIGARLQVLTPDGVPLLVLPSPTGGRLVGCCWHEARLYVSEVEAHRLHMFRIID